MLLSAPLKCHSFLPRASFLLQIGHQVLLQQSTSYSAPPTLPDSTFASTAGAVQQAERAVPVVDCCHSPKHCNMTVSLHLLQVLSEKLDVLRLAFYTAPISCAVLLPLFFIREVGGLFPADDST